MLLVCSSISPKPFFCAFLEQAVVLVELHSFVEEVMTGWGGSAAAASATTDPEYHYFFTHALSWDRQNQAWVLAGECLIDRAQ